MEELSVDEAKQIAVNFKLLAYKHGVSEDDRKSKGVILVADFLKKNDAGERVKLVKNIADASRPTKIPRPEEFDFSENANALQTAVWVGMYLPSAQTAAVDKGATNEANEKNEKKSNKMKGKCVLEISKGDVHPHDPNALRVVCPRFRKTATCYALISQNRQIGLCVGAVIEMEDVFFFHEYRDDGLSISSQRKAVWAGKIRDAMGKTEQAKRDAARTYGKTKFLAGKQRSLQNETQQLGWSSELTGEQTSLDKMRTTIGELSPDIKNDIMTANESLRAFIDAQKEPTDVMCKAALGEISQLWPAVHQILNVDSLMEISRCIRAANISIPWPLVRMFLVETKRNLDFKPPVSDEDASLCAITTMKYLELLLGAPVNSKGASVSTEAKFFETEARFMKKHADLIQQRDGDEAELMEE